MRVFSVRQVFGSANACVSFQAAKPASLKYSSSLSSFFNEPIGLLNEVFE